MYLDLVPTFCSDKLETQPQLREISLKSPVSENGSFVQIGASILQGVNIVQNYKCFISIYSPPGTGLVLTLRKAALNDADVIVFRSSGVTEPKRWRQDKDEDDSDFENLEVIANVDNFQNSSISITYEPSTGDSQFNAGFDLAVTSFKGRSHCLSAAVFLGSLTHFSSLTFLYDLLSNLPV